MAGLAQVVFRTFIPKIATENVAKDAARLVSTSAACRRKHQYGTPVDRFQRAKTATSARKAGKRIDSVAASLASKGFLRSKNPYVPPKDVVSQVSEIFARLKVPTDKTAELHSLEQKYVVLQACSDSFKHSVPNSQIHEIKTFDDVVKFYETPVDTTTPFDALQRVQLPENLHIQQNYVRFHPETDTMFGGKSAFPKSSTLVTGLKYRNKYQGHIAKRSWP